MKKKRQFNDNYIKNIVKKHYQRLNLDFSLIDWHSLDRSSPDTLVASLLDNYGIDLNKISTEPTNSYIQEQKKIQISKESEKVLSDFKKSKIEGATWTENDPFTEARTYIRMVASGFWNSAIIVSETGMGKSHLVMTELKDSDYNYYNTFATPLSLVKILYENKDDPEKIIILDDVEGILSSIKGISILKACLWANNSVRIVCYESTSDKRSEIPQKFEFKAKIIILCNDIKTDPNTKAIVSRSNTCFLNFTYQDKIKILEKIAKKKYKDVSLIERQKILNFIKENTSQATKDFNLRTYFKILELYRYEKEKWMEISKTTLKTDETKSIFLKIEQENQNETVNYKIDLFKEATGLSRRTYFLLKKELNPKKTN